MTKPALLLPALLLAIPSAQAAERSFTVTGFEKIRVDGPYAVSVVTDGPPSARAKGDARALDAISAVVQGRTLVIRRDPSWGGFPGEKPGAATVAVSTHELSSASLSGSGSLAIDRMKGLRVGLAIAGSGKAVLGRVDADRLDLSVDGSGMLEASGKAGTLSAAVRGSGAIAAPGLTVADAAVTASGAGDVTLAATRSAKVIATGTGNVTISGDPACTATALGSGIVTCGHSATK